MNCSESMKGVNPIAFWSIIAVILIALFFIGGAIINQSINVAGCVAQWSSQPRTVVPGSADSYLCPRENETCTADPYILQHNAYVEALVCACQKAVGEGSYPYSDINMQIESAFKKMTNFTMAAKDICEGGNLVKWRYRG